jgi:septal ring factor EnvC (AmiA/AmiB activator)
MNAGFPSFSLLEVFVPSNYLRRGTKNTKKMKNKERIKEIQQQIKDLNDEIANLKSGQSEILKQLLSTENIKKYYKL